MSDTIYLVEESVGSYDDYRRWAVCWYPTRAEAEARAARFNAALEAWMQAHDAEPQWRFDERFDWQKYERDLHAFWRERLAVVRPLALELGRAYKTDDALVRAADGLGRDHHGYRVREVPRGP